MLVFEGLLGEGTLAPLTLKITTKALVTCIGEQLHIWAASLVCIIQVTDPIPGQQVGQPPLDVSSELCIQLDVVMQVMCLLGYFYYLAQEGPTWEAYPANKMKFANERKYFLLSGQLGLFKTN